MLRCQIVYGCYVNVLTPERETFLVPFKCSRDSVVEFIGIARAVLSCVPTVVNSKKNLCCVDSQSCRCVAAVYRQMHGLGEESQDHVWVRKGLIYAVAHFLRI